MKFGKRSMSVLLVVLILMTAMPMSVIVNAETTLKAGDVIEFGSYPKNDVTDFSYSGKTVELGEKIYSVEPIEWRVLRVENGKALLLTDKIIDAQAYNHTIATVDGYYGNNYAHSDIRDWLIEDFYNTAFSSYEKNAILPTTLDNSAASTNVNASGSYTKYSSEATTDQVFLLSKSEADNYAAKYFSTTATDYAYGNGFRAHTSTELCNQWTLRTAGGNYMQIYYVQIRWGHWTTYFNWDGDGAIVGRNGIRPAIYIDIEAYIQQQNSAIAIYSTHASNYLSVGDNVDLIVGSYVNGEIDENCNEYLTVISDSNILDLTVGEWNNKKGRHYSVQAKKQGVSTVTFTDPKTNKSSAFTFYVENPETAYTFYNIPELTYEEGKTTNFYNYGGLVVDDFSYKAHEENGIIDYYTVTMTVYNKCNLYGAVTSYNANGVIYEYDLIERMKDFDDSFTSSLETLWYEFGDLYYLLGNEYYYSGQSITKENKISVRVPVGGHISISNNISTSEVAFLANTVYAVSSMMSVAKEYIDIFTPDKFNEEAVKAVVSTITGEVVNKEIEASLKSAVKDSLNNYKLSYKNINEFISEIANKTAEFGFNIAEAIEKNILSVTGAGEIAESYITAIIPTGAIINLLYASNNALDYTLFNNEYSLSPNKPTGINIYAPNNENAYISGGVQIVPNNGSLQSNIVTHSYIVEDIDLSQVSNSDWIDSNDYMHYKQKMYSITMYKDGDETQPDSTVKVRIPLPEGFRTQAIKVYRYNDDGSITDMNAYTENGYVLFETNHFSYYLILDESAEHNKDILISESKSSCVLTGKREYECSVCGKIITEVENVTGHSDENTDGICDICNVSIVDSSSCNHICHSDNWFFKIIWTLYNFLIRIFSIERYCPCGVAHY